jgi:hypothetical protein
VESVKTESRLRPALEREGNQMTTTIDETKVEEFLGKVLGDTAGLTVTAVDRTAEAGFAGVERLPLENPFNNLYALTV